ncbi:MAG: transposase [Gammaproteobacteria bacterium]|nr:transposase [Gammaproteobacteria bacterium]
MIIDRLNGLMHLLTDRTVFADLLAPLDKALARVRQARAGGCVLSMPDFIALGVLRHLQSRETLREQVQSLLHLAPETTTAPLAHSTGSDALSSEARRAVLSNLLPALMRSARDALPDRLAKIPGLGDRPVRAIDGTYQRESAHYGRCTPKEGGNDNPKGHALLSFFDVRLGLPENVSVDTRNRHETMLLRDYDQTPHAVTRDKNVVWLVDRAFIDARYWDAKKKTLGSTLITRMKSNLAVRSFEAMPFEENDINEGVVLDLRVELASSPQNWRLVTYRVRPGHDIEFLTNDFDLQPGVIAFLYSRRWDEEKCFDTWKNDFSQAKAWGKGIVAIDNQVRLAIITSILIAILLQETMGEQGIVDEKSLKKQDKRQAGSAESADGTDRPDWTAPLFRYTSKVSRQVLRFFRFCFLKRASPELYQRELRPMLLVYL